MRTLELQIGLLDSCHVHYDTVLNPCAWKIVAGTKKFNSGAYESKANVEHPRATTIKSCRSGNNNNNITNEKKNTNGSVTHSRVPITYMHPGAIKTKTRKIRLEANASGRTKFNARTQQPSPNKPKYGGVTAVTIATQRDGTALRAIGSGSVLTGAMTVGW